MSDLAALADELERRVFEMGRSPRPENDAISLGFYIAGQVQALLSALRASRPEPAAYAVERHLHAALSDLEREERAHGETIDQRDAAESALSEAYLIVTGQPPEWSNRFGYREALDDIRGALPRPSVVIVTDEMVDVAIDRWAGFREWRDTVCAGSRRLEMRAAIEAALTATCPVVPDCCPVCGGDCGSANPPVMDCPMRPERGGALPRPAVDEGAVERATLAAYDAFFEGQIGCCEPSWDELPDSHKDRMRRSIRAALAAAQSPTNTAGD